MQFSFPQRRFCVCLKHGLCIYSGSRLIRKGILTAFPWNYVGFEFAGVLCRGDQNVLSLLEFCEFL